MNRTGRISPRRWQALAILLLLLLGTLRALVLLLHQPLLAYANSYDQTRYTACFDLYPERAADIAPTQNSPAAPFSRYVFITTDDPMCYWSSDLLVQGAVVAGYKLSDMLTSPGTHEVRWIGGLRALLMVALCAALSVAWWRRQRPLLAIANAALWPLLFADPANTLYLSTFYAEWSALLAAYATISLILLYADQARVRRAFGWLALAALLLATSKIQHLLLPLALAAVALICTRLRGARCWSGQNFALLLGALAGLCLQVAQLQRGGEMMQTIRQYNSADVLLTALLPSVADPVATLAQLQIDPECLHYLGKPAWQLPGLPNEACPGLAGFTRGRELALLAQQPLTLLRIGWRGIENLSPWMADNLGHVEGAEFVHLGAGWLSLSDLLCASRVMLFAVFLMPTLVLIVMLLRRRWRYSPFLLFTALIATTQQSTLWITVLGDGLADTAKQGGLAINAGLAWCLVSAMLLLAAAVRTQRTPTTPSISSSSSARQTSP